jgi:hypothetical protein
MALRQAIVLLTEKNRMAKYAELQHEIKRQDSLLLQHITDMETFEITSKQNRQKVLMGMPPLSSPLLS